MNVAQAFHDDEILEHTSKKSTIAVVLILYNTEAVTLVEARIIFFLSNKNGLRSGQEGKRTLEVMLQNYTQNSTEGLRRQ